jgi:hypothetical protein
MNKVTQKKACRNRQKQARRMNRIHTLRKKRKRSGRPLTNEQKKDRREKLNNRKESKQKRKQLIAERSESKNVQRIQKALSSVFSIAELDLLAKSTGFIKRQGSITAFAFVYMLSFGFLGNGSKALTYLVGGLRDLFGVNVTAQALSKRINTKFSTIFLRSVMEKLLETQLSIGLKNHFSELFYMFSGIFLEDSTAVTLNEDLSEDFRGSGGGASKSALKIQCIFDIMTNLMHSTKITSGIVPDVSSAYDVLKCIKRGCLIIRDLGYFSIPALAMIEKKCAYYLSRLSITTNVYLNETDTERLDVPDFLKRELLKENSSISIPIYVGQKERFKTRLVAEKVPAHVSEQRKAKYKEKHKKSPPEYYKEWCGYSIFITNIPENIFSSKMIISLYKIRWQIELVFLNLKMNIEIDVMKGTNKHRIEGLVYGRLITILTICIIQNYAINKAGNREVSGNKLTKWLISDNRLHQAIRKEGMSLLLITLECDLILVCKQQRKRQTTQELIEEIFHMEKNTINQEALLCA